LTNLSDSYLLTGAYSGSLDICPYNGVVRDNKKISIANDNEVAYRRSQGNVLGRNVVWQDDEFQKRESAQSAFRAKAQDNGPVRPFGKAAVSVTEAKYEGSLAFSLLLWITSISALIGSVIIDANGTAQFLASIIVIWMGLWVGYLGHDRQKSRLSDVGVFTAIIGVFSAILIIGSQFDIALLSMTNCLGIMSFIAFICAAIVHSGIALVTSACFLLLAAFLHFSGQAISPVAILAFPALWISQVLLASKFKSRLALGLIMGVGAYCIYNVITGAVTTGYLPTHLAVTVMVLLGVLQFQFGKVVQASQAFGGYLHILCGWLLAICGLIALQFYWFEPRMVFWKAATLSNVNQIWMPLVMGLLTIGTLLACLMRWKHDNLKLSGVVIISGLFLAFGGIHLFSEDLYLYFQTNPPVIFSTQLNVMLIPMALACTVLTGAGMMIFNSFRWGRLAMLCAGFAAMAFQIYLISKADLFTPDNIITFILLAATALCVSVYLSSRTLSNIDVVDQQRLVA